MKCIYCNKELREGAKYCAECGKLQEKSTNEIKNNTSEKLNPAIVYILRNRKKLIIVLLILAIILGISFAIPKDRASALIGTWQDDRNYEVSFSENKKFTEGTLTTGTYEIYDDNKLVMLYQGFDYIDRNTWTYKWSKENKGKKDYWYISGNTLYIGESIYTKKSK